MSQMGMFDNLTLYVQTNNWCKIELLLLQSNTLNHLTVCQRMSYMENELLVSNQGKELRPPLLLGVVAIEKGAFSLLSRLRCPTYYT